MYNGLTNVHALGIFKVTPGYVPPVGVTVAITELLVNVSERNVHVFNVGVVPDVTY